MLVKLQILAPPQTEWLKTREGGPGKMQVNKTSPSGDPDAY